MTGRVHFSTSRILVRFYAGPWGGVERYIDKAQVIVRHGRDCFIARTDRGDFLYGRAKRKPTGYGAPERWQLIDPRTGGWTSENELREKYEMKSNEELEREAVAKLPWERYGAEVPL